MVGDEAACRSDDVQVGGGAAARAHETASGHGVALDGRTRSCTKRWPTMLQAQTVSASCASLWPRTWSWRRNVFRLYACCSLRCRSGRSGRRLVSTLRIAASSSRMVSRIGCCVEQMLRDQHLSLPVALFRLLRTPTEATAKELMATPECLRDSWSAHFLKEYPDPCADEALAALTAIVVLCKVDIAQIECHHAAVKSRT